MARKESSAWNCIHAMCDAQHFNESVLYEKAKLLLGCYRRVCWAATGRCEAIADEEFCYCDNGLGTALGYLQGFEPAAEKPHFESKIRSLFETRWMIELVDNAMLRVKEFPDYGEHYFEILAKSYLNRFKYNESDLLDILHIERSCYYDRKKEAIMVFGIAMWGKEIPRLQTFLVGMSEEDAYIPKLA